jgi:hypothetical protein
MADSGLSPQRHVGRDGISLRGLVDPFDLSAALKASAIHLRDLRNRFGNVGPSHVGVSPHVRRNPLSTAGQSRTSGEGEFRCRTAMS